MMIKEYKVKRENSNKFDKKVELKCDKCSVVFQMFHSAFCKSQKRHFGRHLCSLCANAGEFKKKIIGINSKKFKNGLSPSGYRRIYYNGRNQFEHRVMAEKKIGRSLYLGEEVHHINGVKLDNSFDNLYIFSSKKLHRQCHCAMEDFGLSLLGKYIWFDQNKREYVTSPCEKFDPNKEYGNFVIDHKIIPQQQSRSNKRYLFKYGTNRNYHIFIIESIIKRKLYRDEIVHHINGVISDNSINNLYLTTRDEHRRMHESLDRCIYGLCNKSIVIFINGEYVLNEQ